LQKGERLKTPAGTLAVADGGTTPKVRDGWMWDLTVPGDNDHDFYVLPADSGPGYYHVDKDGVTAILVHNQNPYCDISRLKGFARQIREAGNSSQARNQRVFAVGQDGLGNLTAASSDGWDAGQRDMLKTLNENLKFGIRRVASIADNDAEENLIADNQNTLSPLERVGTDPQLPCGPEQRDCAGQMDRLRIEHE
jgi:hypothetical protein